MMDQEFNPLSNKYPGWSPYDYVEDNPTGSVDPNGASSSTLLDANGNPAGVTQYFNIPTVDAGTGKVPISLAGSKEFNPASISANGFAGLSSSKGMTGIVKSLGSLGESYDYVTTGVGLLGKVLSSQGLRDFSSEMGNYAFAANLFAALPTLSKVATGKRSLTAGTAYDVVTPFVATEIGSAIGTDGTSLLVGLGFQEAKGAYDFLKYTVTPKLVQIQESLMSLPERMMGGAQ